MIIIYSNLHRLTDNHFAFFCRKIRTQRARLGVKSAKRKNKPEQCGTETVVKKVNQTCMFGSSEDEQVIVLCSLSGAYSSQRDAVSTSTSCLSHFNKKYFVPVIETVCFENNARDGGSESRASGRSRTGRSGRLGCVPTNHRLLLAEATGPARRSEPERVIRGMSRAIYQNLPPPMGHLHTHT